MHHLLSQGLIPRVTRKDHHSQAMAVLPLASTVVLHPASMADHHQVSTEAPRQVNTEDHRLPDTMAALLLTAILPMAKAHRRLAADTQAQATGGEKRSRQRVVSLRSRAI